MRLCVAAPLPHEIDRENGLGKKEISNADGLFTLYRQLGGGSFFNYHFFRHYPLPKEFDILYQSKLSSHCSNVF